MGYIYCFGSPTFVNPASSDNQQLSTFYIFGPEHISGIFKDMFSFFLTPKIVIGLEDKCLGLLSKMESTKTIYQQLCDKYMKKIPICHFCVGVYYLGTDRKVIFCGI